MTDENSSKRGEHLGDWLSPGRFALVLAALIGATFPSVLLGLDAFAYGDSAQFAYPVAYYHRECFWQGQLPLWNPLNSCGIPFLAQWNTLTLYPLSLIYLLLPMPWSFGVFCLGHLFLGGMGMYYLAHRWTGNRLAAAVAGAVFAFNGFTWYGLMWPHITAGLAWMPWVVLSMETAWRRERRFIVLAALAGATQLLTGGAEPLLLTWLLLGLLWLAELVANRANALKLLLRAGVAGGLAAALAAAQLLPFLELLAHSQRGTAYASGELGQVAAMPLTGWMNFLLPLFHCARNPSGMFVQAGQSWTSSYYLGIGIVALAGLAVWRARDRRVWLLAAVVLFSILMALGPQGGFYLLIKRLVPLVGFIRFPVKFLILAVFALPLLAAFGLSWLRNNPPANRTRAWRDLGAVALGLVGLLLAILWYDWHNPVPGSALTTTIANASVRALFLGLLLAVVAWLRPETDGKLGQALQVGLLVVLWFDVFTHSCNLSPTVAAASLEPGSVRQVFKWEAELEPGRSRALQSKASLWRLLTSGNPDLERDLATRRLALSMNLNLLDRVPKFDGFYSLDLKEYLEVFKHVYFTTNDTARLADFLTIAYTSNPTNAVDWVPRESFLPLVTAGQQPLYADGPAVLQSLLSKQFDPRRQVHLTQAAKSVRPPPGPAKVRLGPLQFSAHHLQVDAESDAATVMVVAQSYYPAWRAYIDGQPVPLWRANHAFQAVMLPAGKHQVSLHYEDKAFFWGALLSLLSALSCGAAGWYWRRKHLASGAPVVA